ncbi:MAG: ATP-binding protein [Desulfobacterales bacterium]
MAPFLRNMKIMPKDATHRRFWSGIPPWIFIGAVLVLFPIIAVMTFQDINRQKESSTRMLLEKGVALIRSFEAGTRTGMMGTRWDNLQLQKLLTETAQLPDIEYLLVTDINGTIIVHNNLALRGRTHGKGLDVNTIARFSGVFWRKVHRADGREVFEVFRRFRPTGVPSGLYQGLRMRGQRGLPAIMSPFLPATRIIFVGLDMSTIEAARQSDARQSIIMGTILLMLGFSGVILLFLAHRYRETKTSLSRMKVFSDNLVDNMPIGLLAIDHDNRVASFNHAAASILQRRVEAVIGKDARSILPEQLWAQVRQLENETGVIEEKIDCPVEDGKTIPLDVSTTALRDASDTFLGYIVLFKDLTEVQTLREEISRSQRLASLGSLAAGVAHEIRNPLSSIKGFATYFKEKHTGLPEDRQIAEIMTEEVDRLNRVVGQLLELARPVSISKEPTSISLFVENTLKLVEAQAKEKGIRIIADVSPSTGTVSIDRDRMSQVLLNLYLNAIEAMEQDGCLTVALRTDIDQDIAEIKVSDTGSGISKKNLSRIFDPYYTTKPSGTGLGLAIVHNIIEAHGGEIRAESTPEEGTEITVRLPHAT